MTDRAEFVDLGIRYVIVRASAFRAGRLPGDDALEHVPPGELSGLLRRLALREPELVRRLSEGVRGMPTPPLSASFQPPGPCSSELEQGALLRAFGDSDSSAPGEPPLCADLYMLREPRLTQRTTRGSESAESQRIDVALARLGNASLFHRGESYALLRSGGSAAAFNRSSYDVVEEARLFQVLRELQQDTTLVETRKALLRELLDLAEAQRTKTGSTQLLLLRRDRDYARPASSAPAQTPSQLRKAQATDWLEIVFLSDKGEPMANEAYEVKLSDGTTQSGTLDANGMAYLAGIEPGPCEVCFPDFAPRLAS